MGIGAGRMFEWAVADAAVRAPERQGVGGNEVQDSQSSGKD